MPTAPESYLTLSAMITPAIFLTANGSLIISTSNRLSRIVDRIRVMNDLADQLDRGDGAIDYPAARIEHVGEMLDQLAWRADRTRLALTMLYLSFSAFVGTSLALAFDQLTGNRASGVPTGLAVVGVAVMLAACVNLIREEMEALRSNRREVAFYRELRSRRWADGTGWRASDRTGSGA